jgi:threonine aldolase
MQGLVTWGQPGQAAFDFRSDYVTTPTKSMLEAVSKASLLDDVMMEDTTTNALQAFIADLTSHEDSLLMVSGTMANQVALKTALRCPPYSVLCDRRSHVFRMEAGGVAAISGALSDAISPANGHHLVLEDILEYVVQREDVYDCPTRVISLENTLNGTVMPLQEIRRISQWARSQDPPIHLHLDGARIWEVVAAAPESLKDFTMCFDSVGLCFTKGLGAPIGSIVVGSSDFIRRARIMRKLLGGGMRQSGIIAACARVSVEHVFLTGMLHSAHHSAQRISRVWQTLGGKLQYPTETNMVWLDLDAANIDGAIFENLAGKKGCLTMRGRLQGRLVFHHQICEDALRAMERLMEELLGRPSTPPVL